MCLIVFAWQPGTPCRCWSPPTVTNSMPARACRWRPGRTPRGIRRTRPGGRRHLAGARPGRPFRRPDQRPRSVAGSRQALLWRTGGGLPARAAATRPTTWRRSPARRGLFRLQPASLAIAISSGTTTPRRATAPAAGGDLRAVQRGPRYALAEAAQGSRRPRRAACRAASAGPAGAAGRRSAGRRRPAAGYRRGSGHGTPALQRVHRQPELRHSRQQRRTGTRRRHAGDDRAQLRPSGARFGEVSLVLPPG